MKPAPQNQKPKARRLLDEVFSMARFGLVGVLATIVYYASAVSIEAGGVAPQQANLLAYLLSTSVSFLGHFHFTFGKSGRKLPYIWRFIPVSVAGYVISRVVVFVGNSELALPFWITAFAVAVAVAAFTWVVSRFWAFK